MKSLFSTLISIIGLASLAIAQTTKEEQSALTPDKVLVDLMDGNARFANGQPRARELKASVTKSASGQYPKAVVLSCLSTREFRWRSYSIRGSATFSSVVWLET